MLDEIQVGEYVRTKSGNIGKVLDITNVTMQKRKKYLIKWNISKAYYITAIRIVKHSKNIIDLIEAGDILKIKDSLYDAEYKTEVFENYEDDLCVINFEVSEVIPIRKFIEENQMKIKSIVTKEQFKNIEYRLED